METKFLCSRVDSSCPWQRYLICTRRFTVKLKTTGSKSGSVYDLPLTRVCSRSSTNVIDVAVVVIVVVVALNDRYKTLNGLFRRFI